MLQSISKQTAESLSDSKDTTTLLGDFLRNEGIIGFEYRIESAYQEIALNNLRAIAKRYAINHSDNHAAAVSNELYPSGRAQYCQ